MDDLDNLFILKDNPYSFEDVQGVGQPCEWDRGTYISQKEGVHYLVSGLIIVRRTLEDGQSKSLFIVQKKHFFHDIAYAQQIPGLTQVSALRKSSGLYFSPGSIEKLFRISTDFVRAFLFSLACKGRTLGTDATMLGLLPSHKRLYFLLENLAVYNPQSSNREFSREVQLSQVEIGEYLSLRRESVNRLIQKLEKENLIFHERGKIWLR